MWATCDTLLRKGLSPTDMGFRGNAGDLNRFRSRYRVAKSFCEVILDSYTPPTVAGYSALFRVFLVWSAVEQFLKITKLSIQDMKPVLTPYNPDALADGIKSVKGYTKFLEFVRNRLDAGNHQNQLKAFLDNQACNILYIPAGIRHIFAHGILTPSSGVGSPRAAKALSDLLCEFLFRVMDGEFVRRLKESGIKV